LYLLLLSPQSRFTQLSLQLRGSFHGGLQLVTSLLERVRESLLLPLLLVQLLF
jgi:hypothetical protein